MYTILAACAIALVLNPVASLSDGESGNIDRAIKQVSWTDKWPDVKVELSKRLSRTTIEWMDATESSKLPRSIPRDIKTNVFYASIKDGSLQVRLYVAVADGNVRAVAFADYPRKGLTTSIEMNANGRQLDRKEVGNREPAPPKNE